MNEFQTETIRAAAEVIDQPEQKDRSLLVLSTGVRLRLRTVPPLLLNTVVNKFTAPTVPRVFIEDDDRFEENPNDPDYQAALIGFAQKQQEAMINLLIGRGTQLEEVPAGIDRPEGEGWLEEVREYLADVPAATQSQRYLSWLRFYALADASDLAALTVAVMRFSGLTEEEVAEATESFRGDGAGAADNGSALAVGSENGHLVPAVAPGLGY